MAKTTRHVLEDSLEDLDEKQMKKFFARLVDPEQEEPRVKKGAVGDPTDRVCVVNAIVGTYTEAGAGRKAVEILREINCNDIAKSLEKNLEKLKRTASRPSANSRPTSPLSTENESHMHTVSSSETNTSESAPQLHQATEDGGEDTQYHMKAQQRGFCLIVNNFDFSLSPRNQSNRMGTHIDEESLRRVFTWLGFQVVVLRDATRVQMLDSIRELTSRDHSGMDCVACVVLSHGLEGGVYGVDGEVVRLKELQDPLNGVLCAALIGKPKLFFIQACQGNQNEQAVQANRPARPEVSDQTDGPSSTGVHTQTDGPSSTGDLCGDSMFARELIPSTADFLTAMATTPSYVSMRDEERGSWFIQSLCQNFVKLVPCGQDVVSMLTTVNKDVSQKFNRIGGRRQMPQLASSLRMFVVFPVPEGPPPSLPTSS